MNDNENNEPKMILGLSEIVYLGFREFNEMYKQKLEEDKRHHLAFRGNNGNEECVEKAENGI